MTTVQLPELAEGKKVVILLSGGLNSTLLAYLSMQKYGRDNVIPLFIGFDAVSKIEQAKQQGRTDTRSIQVLRNRLDSFTKLRTALGMGEGIILDSIEKYNSGSTNLIRDKHRANYIEVLLNIVCEHSNLEPETIQYALLGHEKLDFEIRELNELDVTDGVILNIKVDEVRQYVSLNSDRFSEVIRHDVLDNWHEWAHNNAFYKLDHDQYAFGFGEVQCYFPFQSTTKTEIVQLYRDMGLDHLLEQTISCHSGPLYPTPCGHCNSCSERMLALYNVSAPAENSTS